MGGGALSSDCVSRLVGKEVSKRLVKLLSSPLAGEEAVVCEAKRALQMQERGISSCYNKTLSRISKFTAFTKKFNPLPEVEGKYAFTLAEVLITLGVIGVVAALTLPSVVAKFQQKSFATAFKKEYSNVNNAINMLVNEEDVKECYQTVIRADGGHLIYSANNSDCYALKTGLISKLKLTKIKKDFTYPSQNEVLNQGGVTANSTVAYDGWIKNVSRYAYLSPDGAVFIFSYSSTPGDNYREIPFIIDVNGKKGPNRWGYDVFWLSLVKNGNGIRLSDEYATLSEKGGSLPRNILLNNWSNDYNKNVNWGLWK